MACIQYLGESSCDLETDWYLNQPNSRFMNRKANLFILGILCILITSCIPKHKIEYLQYAPGKDAEYRLPDRPETQIKPNDELYIKVSSFDDVNYNFFNAESDYARTGFSNELSLSLISYTVNDSGYIHFPVLGLVDLNGLSLKLAQQRMEDILHEYFNQPSVIIKFAYKKVSILGEVNVPGNYTYTKDRINIFEALSMAGDCSVHSNIENVVLLRAEGNTIQKHIIDLSDDKLVFSKYYYLKADDILYIKPRSSKQWNVISTPISLILSSITAAVLVLDFSLNNP